uniref:NTR domain-containing protein n=1 Tax=Strigamia maritima TaxID=126957 RepID=T1J800_STRMM
MNTPSQWSAIWPSGFGVCASCDMATWIFLLFAAFLMTAGEARPTGYSDGCDWVGSGLDHPNQERGVQPVYLRCSQGTVFWRWPRGALRIVLRMGSAGRDFKGCLRANSSESARVRVYLEGKQKLHLLFAATDGRPSQLPRCFNSHHGQVALYVEADTASSSLDDRFEFIYDLQPFRSSKDPLEECKPCTEEELLHNFCVSDFVAKGIITSIRDNNQLERSEIKIKAHKVIREATTPVFKQQQNMFTNDELQEQYTTLHVPSKCHVMQDDGEFVFMGRLRLGDPILRCAPRLEEWNKLKDQVAVSGRSQCTLE